MMAVVLKYKTITFWAWIIYIGVIPACRKNKFTSCEIGHTCRKLAGWKAGLSCMILSQNSNKVTDMGLTFRENCMLLYSNLIRATSWLCGIARNVTVWQNAQLLHKVFPPTITAKSMANTTLFFHKDWKATGLGGEAAQCEGNCVPLFMWIF